MTSTLLHPASGATTAVPKPLRRVVDAPTRMFHWLFALSFLGAYVTADGESFRLLHVTLGYTMAGLLVFRVLYGLFGPKQAGLGALWRKLSSAPMWFRSLTRMRSLGDVNWRQGQNLLMALAVLALLVLVIPITLTGYGTYNDWGGEWLEDLHEVVGETLLWVVLAHLALVLGLSVLRGKNQVTPMLTGQVEGPGPHLVQKNRGWLAGLLLVAVLAYGAWEWQQSPNGLISTKALSSLGAGHSDDD